LNVFCLELSTWSIYSRCIKWFCYGTGYKTNYANKNRNFL
jgi:hypothetical protein